MAAEIRIKLDDPGIGPSDERAALAVLRSGQLVCGPRVGELEARLAERTGRRHAVCVSSGTAALYLAFAGLGVGPGSTVVVPALTFPAPAVAAALRGAAVRVCDVEPDTFNLSPRTLGPVLDDAVSLVVAVDQFGNPAPTPALEELLTGRDIPLLVDAACSLGSTLDGRPCGAFGRAAVLSFHPRKVITTGEGGAVLTDDDELARQVRLARNIGMEGREFRALGLNLRPSEIGAAVGASQLARIDETLERRRALAVRYRALPLEFQEPAVGSAVNHQTVAALLPEGTGPQARDELFAELAEQGVELGIPSYCVGALPWLAERLAVDTESTPVALDVSRRGVALPLHAGLSEGDVDEVVEAVRSWLDRRGARP